MRGMGDSDAYAGRLVLDEPPLGELEVHLEGHTGFYPRASLSQTSSPIGLRNVALTMMTTHTTIMKLMLVKLLGAVQIWSGPFCMLADV